jgi:hypothetical protein
MELLIMSGVLALALLAGFALYFVLRQRRAGTVKAVVAPRTGLGRAANEADEEVGTETGAT